MGSVDWPPKHRAGSDRWTKELNEIAKDPGLRRSPQHDSINLSPHIHTLQGASRSHTASPCQRMLWAKARAPYYKRSKWWTPCDLQPSQRHCAPKVAMGTSNGPAGWVDSIWFHTKKCVANRWQYRNDMTWRDLSKDIRVLQHWWGNCAIWQSSLSYNTLLYST